MGSMVQNPLNFTPPPGGLVFEYCLESYLNSLPAYANSQATDQILEPLRRILREENYALAIRVVPSTQQQNFSNDIPASQMFEDQISVPEGSFLFMIGGCSFQVSDYPQTATAFRLRLFDVGSQSYLSDDFVRKGNSTGHVQGANLTSGFVDGATLGQTGNNGLYVLQAPISIASPGQLNVQIVNLATVAARVDMAFYFAVPVGDKREVAPGYVGNEVTKRNYV